MIAGRLALPYLFFLFLSLSCHFFTSSYSSGSERSHAAAAHPHPIPLQRVPCAPHGTSGISSRPPASEPNPRPSDLHQPQPGGQRVSPSALIGPPAAAAGGPASEPHEPSIGPPAAARPRPASEPIRAHRPTGSSSLPPAPGQRAPSASALGQQQSSPGQPDQARAAAGRRGEALPLGNTKTPKPPNPKTPESK